MKKSNKSRRIIPVYFTEDQYQRIKEITDRTEDYISSFIRRSTMAFVNGLVKEK
jgi:hypothetical protein